jgi:hypothetical protein
MARTLLFLAPALALAAAAAPAGARSMPGAAAPRPPAAVAPGHGNPGAFHPGRHRPWHGGRDLPAGAFLYGVGAVYEDYPAAADGGFFSQGEAVPARGGVLYLYDRSYPYEYYRPARTRAASWREPEPEPQACATRWEGPVAIHSCRR